MGTFGGFKHIHFILPHRRFEICDRFRCFIDPAGLLTDPRIWVTFSRMICNLESAGLWSLRYIHILCTGSHRTMNIIPSQMLSGKTALSSMRVMSDNFSRTHTRLYNFINAIETYAPSFVGVLSESISN